MELEELQKAWKELNERVSQNELVHQQQIIEMLSRQKESCLQRMLRMDKIASIFMLGVTILMFVDFIHLNGKLVFWPAIFGLLLYALTVNFAGVILLTKIKKETNLEMQIKNILRYKMLINWSYIIGYLLVTPFYMHIPLHLPPPVVAHDNNVWFNLSRCTDRLLPLPSCIGQN